MSEPNNPNWRKEQLAPMSASGLYVVSLHNKKNRVVQERHFPTWDGVWNYMTSLDMMPGYTLCIVYLGGDNENR